MHLELIDTARNLRFAPTKALTDQSDIFQEMAHLLVFVPKDDRRSERLRFEVDRAARHQMDMHALREGDALQHTVELRDSFRNVSIVVVGDT